MLKYTYLISLSYILTFFLKSRRLLKGINTIFVTFLKNLTQFLSQIIFKIIILIIKKLRINIMIKNTLIAFLFICIITISAQAEEIKIEKAQYNNTSDNGVIFEINYDDIKKDKNLVDYDLKLIRNNINIYKDIHHVPNNIN